jgi:DNA repair exonuclease SbcCD ATPase subunit
MNERTKQFGTVFVWRDCDTAGPVEIINIFRRREGAIKWHEEAFPHWDISSDGESQATVAISSDDIGLRQHALEKWQVWWLDYENSGDDIEASYFRYLEQVDVLNAKLRIETFRLKGSRDACASLHKRIAAVANEREDAIAEAADLRRQLGVARAEIADLKESNAYFRDVAHEIKRTKSQYNDLAREINPLRRELAELQSYRARFLMLKAERDSLVEAYEALRENFDAVMSKLSAVMSV